MRSVWVVNALGYERPPTHPTEAAAIQHMAACVAEDKTKRKDLTKIAHSKHHTELKIGGKQGVHTYSEYWVEEIK